VTRNNETAVHDVFSQKASYPALSHSHPSGHSTATLTGTITKHNQNITAGVANSMDSNTTVSIDGTKISFNLHRERESERERGTDNDLLL
jgi:hypothetical protein